MSEIRLSVRVEGTMAEHVSSLIESKLYHSQSEYVRDLIRKDMSFNHKAFVNRLLEALASPKHPMEDDYFDKKLKMIDEM